MCGGRGGGGGNTGNQAWPETKVGLAGKVGGMTFWKQISQANLPLPLFLLIILFSRSLPSRRTPLSQRLKQVTFYFAGSLSSVEASLYRREGWRDGKRKREGDDGKGKGEKASFLARFLFFDYCYFYWDTQREPLLRRESLDWMLRGGRRGLGTGKTV